MTLATITNTVAYLGNAVTTKFSVPFYFLLDSDLVLTTTTGATVVSLGLNIDYTVSGAGSLDGGTVTLSAAPGNTTTLTITRIEPLTQLLDYVQDDAFPAESHEKGLDKLTMICQQLSTQINSLMLAGITDATTFSNLGGGLGVYKQKVGVQAQLRSLSSPANGTVGLAIASDRIEIDVLKVISQSNAWTAGEQDIVYNIPTAATHTDHHGWLAIIHNNVGTTNKDNMVPLFGASYHDGLFDNDTGGAWGVITEVWTNSGYTTTAVGAEFGVIAQCANKSYPSVGMNAVFKNRRDVDAHPAAAAGLGPYFNQKSSAILVSSQARPDSSWATFGSGWNIAFRIGDPGFGSGLDWEGGNAGTTGTPSTIRNWSTIMDMTNASKDLAGGWPWIWLWRTGATYFGARFVDTITTGAIELSAQVPVAGGAGYAVNDVGTIDEGTGGTYKVLSVTAGAVTGYSITAPGTLYYVNPSNGTTATSGGGSGFRINIEQVVGERIEFWRMVDPGNPGSGGGQRYGFIDLAYNPLNDRGGAFLRAFP